MKKWWFLFFFTFQDANGQIEKLPVEVLVEGNLELQHSRNAMLSAEREAYEVFNKFNDVKKFKINCSLHRPTGTNLSQQICMPAFEADLQAGHAREFLDSYRAFMDPTTPETSQVPTGVPFQNRTQYDRKKYKLKIKEIAEMHPEFLKALIHYADKKKEFEESLNLMNKNK